MRQFLLVVAAILGFFLISATALYLLATSRPSALIYDDTCPPPCWLGITLAETSPWEVMQILVEAPFVDQGSIRQAGDPPATDHITWRFRRPVRDLAGYVYFTDGRASHIRIVTLGAMSLREALEKYGEPEAFWLQTRDRPAERWTQLNIIYPEIGCLLEIRFDYTGKPAPTSVSLTEGTPIRAITYFNPGDATALFPVPVDEFLEWQGLTQVPLPMPTQ